MATMSKVKIAQIRKRDGSIVPFDAMKVPVIASSDGIGGEANVLLAMTIHSLLFGTLELDKVKAEEEIWTYLP
jgi:hypothetical protein